MQSQNSSDIENSMIDTLIGYFNDFDQTTNYEKIDGLYYHTTIRGSFIKFMITDDVPDSSHPNKKIIPLSYISLKRVTYGQIKGLEIALSLVNPNYKRQRLGEKLYIYALTKNNGGLPLISDYSQTQFSHALWARLSSRFNVKGLDLDKKETFNVKANGNILINADADEPIVFGSNNFSNTLLIMYNESPKQNEIIQIGDLNDKQIPNLQQNWERLRDKIKKPERGNDGLYYYIDNSYGSITIVQADGIYNKNKPDDVSPISTIFLIDMGDSVQEKLVYVNPKYKKQGFGEKLYRFLIDKYKIMKSDDRQTIYAQALWVKLSKDFDVKAKHVWYEHEFSLKVVDKHFEIDENKIPDEVLKQIKQYGKEIPTVYGTDWSNEDIILIIRDKKPTNN